MYRNPRGIDNVQLLKDNIEKQRSEALPVLDEMLMDEFASLNIKYEQITWDIKTNWEGKSVKRSVGFNEIKALEPFHWSYEFSEIFRKKDGFDAIITNPPWETFQPNAKEFLMFHSEKITKKKMDIKDFEKELQKLMGDKKIRELFLKYKSDYSHSREYYRFSNQYKNQVPIIDGRRHGKDVNLYKLFVEQSFNLLKKGGYCGIVIPSGIYSDLGSKQLREMLFEKSEITGIFCFENRKEVFENVHRSFKFVILSFEKGGTTKKFPAAFMRHEVSELENFPKSGASLISLDFIKRQSPDSLSIMEIKNEIDFTIANKLLQFPALSDNTNGNWNLELHREFNMTDDAYLFHKSSVNNSLPLFEGKMIFNFTHLLAEPRYWIKEKEGRKAILGRDKDSGEILGYQKYRLAYRSIASNTNERTLICSVIPPSFTGNSLNISENLDYVTQFYCVSILSSFVIDWFLRQQVTTNINMFYIFQLPVPRLNDKDKWYKPIVERAAKLICTTEEFAVLWEEVMKTKWDEKVVVKREAERNKLRAELDGIIAHIYGLTEEEFTYVLGTFPIVTQAQKDAALLSYKTLASQFKETGKQEEHLATLIQSGETNKIEFKSTLRVDVKTGKPEKFIEHSVLKTLAAFLNSDGGTLLIGVDDDKNILGLEGDFNSFSKPDKLDEFQKHFDNLISKSLSNRFHRYMQVEFPKQDDKTVCVVTIKEKSSEPVYIINDAGQETFYIRRQASTIELKLSEALTYIKEHWR